MKFAWDELIVPQGVIGLSGQRNNGVERDKIGACEQCLS